MKNQTKPKNILWKVFWLTIGTIAAIGAGWVVLVYFYLVKGF